MDNLSIGRDGEIRTRDPLHPMQVRYQAAPRPDFGGRMLNRATTSCNHGSVRARKRCQVADSCGIGHLRAISPSRRSTRSPMTTPAARLHGDHGQDHSRQPHTPLLLQFARQQRRARARRPDQRGSLHTRGQNIDSYRAVAVGRWKAVRLPSADVDWPAHRGG